MSQSPTQDIPVEDNDSSNKTESRVELLAQYHVIFL